MAGARAKDFLARGDFRDAELSARQVLALNQRNFEACKLMVELAERAHSPRMLEWRRRVVEISPTTENKLSLAAAALRVQATPYPLANEMLEKLKSASAGIASYHVVAAELALRLNHLEEAEAHFDAAAHLEPTNDLHRMNLAVLGLRSTNEAIRLQARVTLDNLSANTNLAIVALRWLAKDGVMRKDWSSAQKYSTLLVASPEANLHDWLQRLEILKQVDTPGFRAFLATTQGRVAANSSEIYLTATWMAGNGLASEATHWLSKLLSGVRAERPVAVAKVECLFACKDWIGAENFLERENWGDAEFRRFALLSRAAQQQKESLKADNRWRLAVQRASNEFQALVELANLATAWERIEAKEDLLWRIAQRFPSERWVLLELRSLYAHEHNTRGLNKAAAALADSDPKDFVARNDFAGTSMLLKFNLPKAWETARELYEQRPQDPVIATTYAYSLHLQGRTRDALEVMDKLKTADLENPSLALYYGLMLGSSGHTNEASRFLGLTKTAKLLQEETELALVALRTFH
jgi:predicted Zn-dependent protease